MSKAEERAMDAYPPKMRYVGIDSVKYDRKIDVNKPMRDRYVKAYHQAEKDLELTVDDIKAIDRLLNQCVDFSNPYEEVLKRLKNLKK